MYKYYIKGHVVNPFTTPSPSANSPTVCWFKGSGTFSDTHDQILQYIGADGTRNLALLMDS